MNDFASILSSCSELADNPVSPVTALRSVAIIAKALHERIVYACRILQRPTPWRALRLAKTGEGRYHKIEDRIILVSRLQQRLHHVLKFGLCQPLSDIIVTHTDSKNVPGQPWTRRKGIVFSVRTRAFSWIK